MRKENVGRLLLSLLTAFVMVAGAFGAAVLTSYSQDDAVGPVAVREHEMEEREMGEAPISALEEQETTWGSINAEETDRPQALRPHEIEVPEGDEVPESIFFREETEEDAISMDVQMPVERGTRASGVDANGPYGTKDAPFNEGDDVLFNAEMIPSGETPDYYFRWNVNEFEGWESNYFPPPYGPGIPGVDNGKSDYLHPYKDNYMGVATVEAWDGFSETTLSGDGNVWQESYPPSWYLYAGYYATHGMKFTVNEDVTVDQLGACRYYYPYQYYNIRLWTSGGTLLAQVSYPYLPRYQWSWFNIAPVNLYAGNQYIVSVGIRGYYQSGEDNPGPTADGVVTPDEWVYYMNSPYGFPSNVYGTTPLPLVDIHYTYSYLIPLVYRDTADCFIDNLAPIVVAAQPTAPTGQEGGETGFTGAFYDVGEDDTHMYRWIWGDGTISGWRSVRKWAGGAYILFCHSYTGDIDPIVAGVEAELGNFALGIDVYDFGPLGEGTPPTLDYLMNYDVVVVGTNWGPIDSAGMGDVLADYLDEGGGVVELVATFYTSPTFAITGRWRDDEYSTFQTGGIAPSSTLGTVYDWSHPIMSGITSWGCSLPISTTGVTAGATELARYTNNYMAAAYRTKGQFNDGKSGRVAGLNIFAPQGYVSGDAWMAIANGIKWASQQPDPTPLPQPYWTDPMYHIYADDHPMHVTNEDQFNVILQVKDDDHEKTIIVGAPTVLAYVDFEASPFWPAGWYEAGDYAFYLHYPYELNGIRCAFRTYYPYGESYLYSPVFDFSALGGAIIEWESWWYTGWSGAYQDGYVEITADGGSTWTVLWEAHHNDPTEARESLSEAFGPAAGSSQVQLRFRIDMYNDWYWEFDDINIMSAETYMMYGLGEGSTEVVIENVHPWAVVPPTHVTVTDENVPIVFEGIEINDPALWVPTEEFWYRWIWDDGQQSDWLFKGSMAPPELDILVMHWVELSSNSGTNLNPLINAIWATDMVGTLDIWNFGPYMENGPPSVTEMGNYDIILYGSNWGQFSSNWDRIRTENGDNLADYQDIYGGGVITFMATYDNSMYYGDLFTMRGRYIDDDYGAWEKTVYPFGAASLDPTSVVPHPVTYDVDELESSAIHSGDYDTTVGGGGMAAGCDGERLARWNDGNSAIGVKELLNGAKSVNLGQGIFNPGIGQGDIVRLLINSFGWAGGVYIPTPVIPTEEHVYADNGIYDVNLQIIDDDMGWLWPFGVHTYPNPPLLPPEPTPDAEISDNMDDLRTEILNVDPVIEAVSAFAEVDLCLRVSGTKNTDCTMTLIGNGVELDSVTVTRDPGSPDIGGFPATIDMTPNTDYELVLECTGGSGGNPTWIFDMHWPDGKYKELKFTFNDEHGWTQTITNLKHYMVGHDIILQVTISDVGSDDLAHIWNFGDGFTANLHGNTGSSAMDTTLAPAGPQMFVELPDREPVFTRGANDIRSPWGGPTAPLISECTHTFNENGYYFVGNILLDDDCNQVPPYVYNEQENLMDGCDSDFTQVDLR
jgi:hypothetical protein